MASSPVPVRVFNPPPALSLPGCRPRSRPPPAELWPAPTCCPRRTLPLSAGSRPSRSACTPCGSGDGRTTGRLFNSDLLGLIQCFPYMQHTGCGTAPLLDYWQHCTQPCKQYYLFFCQPFLDLFVNILIIFNNKNEFIGWLQFALFKKKICIIASPYLKISCYVVIIRNIVEKILTAGFC